METTVNHQSMLFAWSSILAEALQKHPDRSGPFLQGLDLVQSFHRKAGSDGNSSSEIFGSSQGKHIEIRSQSNNACCCCGAHHSPGKLVSHFFRTTGWQVSQDTQWMYMEIRIAAEDIWHTTQLTGCSYLVLQSHNTFWGLASFSSRTCFYFNSQMLYMRCLPRSGGVPTSFYSQIMMFSTNRGTPQYWSPFNQIKAVTHVSSRFSQRKPSFP